MAILIGNETYERFVFDPEEAETKFVVDGKYVAVEDLQTSLDALPEEKRTIDRMVLIPKPDARRINVTFRLLRSYDKHAIQDLTTETGQIATGSGRRMLIKRAVVKWDYETAWSEALLDQLDSGIEEQIYSWISWGVAPAEQDPETGQQVPLEEEKPTPTPKEEKREKKAASSSPKTKDEPVSAEPSADDSPS